MLERYLDQLLFEMRDAAVFPWQISRMPCGFDVRHDEGWLVGEEMLVQIIDKGCFIITQAAIRGMVTADGFGTVEQPVVAEFQTVFLQMIGNNIRNHVYGLRTVCAEYYGFHGITPLQTRSRPPD